MESPELNQFVTVAEAAALLHRTPATIRLWCKRGKVKRKKSKLDLDALRLYAATRKPGPEVIHLAKVERDAQKSEPVAADRVEETREELSKLIAAIESPAGVDGAIDRLRAMERTTFGLYVAAHQKRSPESEQIRARLHADVVQHLLKAEGIVDVRKQVEAEERTKMMEALTAWWEPVKALLDQMPRSMASRCNVADPSVAEASLRDWLLSQLYPMANRKP